jgi:hypothetical protein
MQRRLGSTVLSSVLLALVACGDADTTASSIITADVQVDTVGDTITVHTREGSVWAGRAALVPTGPVIGTLDGPPESIFGRVASIALGSDGALHALDQQALHVRTFAPDGEYVRTFGSPGQGPGEFSKPDAVGVLPDGRILVRDVPAGRVHVFDSTGTFLEGWPVVSPLFGTNAPLETDDLGRTWVDTRYALDDGSLGRRVVVIVDGDGTPLDTLPDPADYVEPATVEIVISSEKGTSRYTANVPFTPSGIWAVHPDGRIVRGTPDGRGVEVISASGAVRRISRQRVPVPVHPEERGFFRDQLTSQLREKSGDWSWNGPEIPETKPEVADIFTGTDGRIWVALSAPGVEVEDPMYDSDDPLSSATVWTQPIVFDVFERDGTWVGTVDAPADFSPYPTPVFAEDGAWAVTRDELGVERIQWFALMSPDAGSNRAAPP